MRVLLILIDELSTWHREVLLVVDMHGYNCGEAAHMLGLPLGTIKSRLCRARMALRDRLVEVGLTPGRPGKFDVISAERSREGERLSNVVR